MPPSYRSQPVAATRVVAGPSDPGKKRKGVFVVLSGDLAGRVIRADEPMMVTFGRGEDCVCQFDEGGVSRLHAVCTMAGGMYLLSDKGSTNGTFVNGKRIEAAAQLSDGDVVTLGHDLRMRFSMVDETERKTLESMYARRTAGTQSHVELEADLADARAFQEQLLSIPQSIANTTVDALYQPFERVGGDVFQVSAISGNRVRLFVADAVGHGVQAALLTMLIVSEYEATKHLDRPVEALLALSNAMASKYGHSKVQFTGMCLDLHLDTGLVRVASGAHPAVRIVRGQNVAELGTGGSFLGLLMDAELFETEAQLAPGEWVIGYTDGLTDAETSDGRLLGDAGYDAALRQAALGGFRPSDSLKAVLVNFPIRRDDLTQVALRWSPTG